MAKITVDVPEEIVSLWTEEELALSVRQWLILELVRKAKISIRRGAELLGLDYGNMLIFMNSHAVSSLHYEENWWEHDAFLQKAEKSMTVEVSRGDGHLR